MKKMLCAFGIVLIYIVISSLLKINPADTLVVYIAYRLTLNAIEDKDNEETR